MLWYPTTTSVGFCFQYLDSRKTSLPSLTCLWKIEVTWCWLELLFMLTVQGFRKFKYFAKNSLNFIYFTTITKQLIQLILIMLVTMFAFRWSSCGRKPEYPDGNPPVGLGDTWPFHIPMPGIEPWSQRWKASMLPLRQSDSKKLMTHDMQILKLDYKPSRNSIKHESNVFVTISYTKNVYIVQIDSCENITFNLINSVAIFCFGFIWDLIITFLFVW